MLVQDVEKGDESSDFADTPADGFNEIEWIEVTEARPVRRPGIPCVTQDELQLLEAPHGCTTISPGRLPHALSLD